jgi:hypothetical protein
VQSPAEHDLSKLEPEEAIDKDVEEDLFEILSHLRRQAD